MQLARHWLILGCIIGGWLAYVQPTLAQGSSGQPYDRAAFNEKVRESSDRAIEYLKRAQARNGIWPFMEITGIHEQNIGCTALVALALLASDRDNRFDTKANIDAAAAVIRREVPKMNYTYTVALSLIFLDRYHKPGAATPEIQALAKKLVEGQNPQNFSWGYNCNMAGDVDNSNTHFAILALLIAKRNRNLQFVNGALEKAERHFRSTQFEDGGWPYMSRAVVGTNRSTPPMTCAGLLGLAIGFSNLMQKREVAMKGSGTDATAGSAVENIDKQLDAFLRDPQVMKARNYIVAQLDHIGKDFEHVTYFLWSMERIAFIYGNDFYDRKDWFKMGCDILLPLQAPNGSWNTDGRQGPQVDTSFALLFLNRVDLLKIRETGFASGSIATTKTTTGTKTNPSSTASSRPQGSRADAEALAKELETALGPRVDEILSRMVECRDSAYTEALVDSIYKAKRTIIKERVREALALRISRLNTRSIRTFMESDEKEHRIAAISSVSMKPEERQKELIGDLIDRLSDRDSGVAKQAYDVLKLVTKQDHGLAAGPWKKWWDAAGGSKNDKEDDKNK